MFTCKHFSITISKVRPFLMFLVDEDTGRGIGEYVSIQAIITFECCVAWLLFPLSNTQERPLKLERILTHGSNPWLVCCMQMTFDKPEQHEFMRWKITMLIKSQKNQNSLKEAQLETSLFSCQSTSERYCQHMLITWPPPENCICKYFTVTKLWPNCIQDPFSLHTTIYT